MKGLKRFFILVTIMALTAFGAGCAKDAESKSTDTKQTPASVESKVTEDDGVYIATIKKVEDNNSDESEAHDIVYNDEKSERYALVSGWNQEEERITTAIKVTDAKTGEELRVIDVEPSEEKNLFMSEFVLTDDDSFICTASVYSEDRQENYLLKIAADGSIVLKKGLSEFPEIPVDSYFYMGLNYDGTYVYVPINGALTVFDKDFGYKKTLSGEGYTHSCVGSDGLVYFTEGYDGAICCYDAKEDKLTKDVAEIASIAGLYAGSEDELLVCTQSSLKSLNIKTGDVTRLFDFLDVNIVSTSFKDVYRDNEGNIVIRFYQYEQEEMMLENGGTETVMRGVPYDAIVKRYDKDNAPVVEEIRLACFYANTDVKTAVNNYNLAHPETKVKIKCYGDDYSDYEEMHSAFNQDILNGAVYDVIIFNSFEVDEYVEKNLVEDLMPYVEGDASFDVSNYFENILFAEKENGKMYRIVSSASVNGLYGAIDTFGDKDVLTIDDIYKARMNNMNIPFMQYGFDSTAFYLLMQNDYRVYLGGETGKYNFKTDEFKKLCEYAGTFPHYSEDEIMRPSDNDIRDGNVVLAPAFFYSADSFLLSREMYGGKCKPYGAPSIEGNGFFISVNTAYSISSLSTHKDEAWNIIKSLLEAKPEFMGYEFRASKERFKADMNYLYSMCNRQGGYSVGMNDEMYKLTMSEEDYKTIEDMITGAVTSRNLPSEIESLVDEELQTYFVGQKPLDDVINVIEKRVNLYLEEKK